MIPNDYWVSLAEELKYEKGVSWSKLSDAIYELIGERIHPERIRAALRRRPRYTITPSQPEEQSDYVIDLHEGILSRITAHEHTCQSLSDLFAIDEHIVLSILEDLKAQGYNIRENNGCYHLSKNVFYTTREFEAEWNGDRVLRFGVLGDTHIGSKTTQLTLLHRTYDLYAKEGITQVFHTGDIIEGEEMRTGHKYECYCQGADEYLSAVINTYPQREGIRTSFITGNHDHSLIKRAGYDIGKSIARFRPDMTYLGRGFARIKLTPECTFEMRHPLGGYAYARSYPLQKIINAMPGGSKPKIMAVGHFHHGMYLPYRNIHAFTTSTFQAQNEWARDKAFDAELGGWIIEIHVGSDGTVRRFKSEYIQFYNPITDDYKNWQEVPYEPRP